MYMPALARIRPHRRVHILLFLSFTLSFTLMLSYNPTYLNYDIKRVLRVLGYDSDEKEPMPRLSFPLPEKQSSLLGRHVSHKAQLKTHVLPWRVLPYGSYRYDDPDFGGHNQPFVYAADISATIPLNSEAMYVLGDGDGLGSGLINIFEDPDESDGNFNSGDVQISLRMYYNSPQMVKFTNISYVQSGHGERGLRIHTPVLPTMKDGAGRRFTVITVKLPRSSPGFPTQLPSFRTHLPNFVHVVGDLARKAHFKSITLSSSNQPMYIESLTARRARIRTSNGRIEGSFTSAMSVSLRTSNAPVEATVKLSNDAIGSSNVEVLSSNERISLKLALDSMASPSSTSIPSFRVLAKSSNKAVDVVCSTAPLAALSQFEVQTSNAPATLRLPPTYEGTFRLHSTPYRPSIVMDESVQDPRELGRKRSIVYVRERRGLVSGEVSWVDQNENDGAMKRQGSSTLGSVSVKTSNAETRLLL